MTNMKKLLIICAIFFAGMQQIHAQQNAKAATEVEMKTYYMVFLKSGENRSQSKEEADKIQAGHMAHINKMAEEGVLILAGPFLDNGDIRGIFIFDVASQEEAEAWTQKDPAVISGRLVMEIHPWYGPKGLTYQGAPTKKD